MTRKVVIAQSSMPVEAAGDTIGADDDYIGGTDNHDLTGTD
jgi:hypothetical protein